jgi:hypothetical protein
MSIRKFEGFILLLKNKFTNFELKCQFLLHLNQ